MIEINRASWGMGEEKTIENSASEEKRINVSQTRIFSPEA
jgi:hypothetical protein